MNGVNAELWEACMIFPDVLGATGQHGRLLQVLQQLPQEIKQIKEVDAGHTAK